MKRLLMSKHRGGLKQSGGKVCSRFRLLEVKKTVKNFATLTFTSSFQTGHVSFVDPSVCLRAAHLSFCRSDSLPLCPSPYLPTICLSAPPHFHTSPPPTTLPPHVSLSVCLLVLRQQETRRGSFQPPFPQNCAENLSCQPSATQMLMI